MNAAERRINTAQLHEFGRSYRLDDMMLAALTKISIDEVDEHSHILDAISASTYPEHPHESRPGEVCKPDQVERYVKVFVLEHFNRKRNLDVMTINTVLANASDYSEAVDMLNDLASIGKTALLPLPEVFAYD